MSGLPNLISSNQGYTSRLYTVAGNGNSSVGKATYLLYHSGSYLNAAESIPANVVLYIHYTYLTNPAYTGE